MHTCTLPIKIGEDEQYEIYNIDGAFLRRNKTTMSIVYLGKGEICSYLNKDKLTGKIVHDENYTTATVFNHWIYWYESNGICSDKFICRRSIDGQFFEKFDWLSNEKIPEYGGTSIHIVSEDKVL